MKASEILGYLILSIAIPVVFMAPPRNVIQMEENNVDKLIDMKLTLKPPVGLPSEQNKPVEQLKPVQQMQPVQQIQPVKQIQPDQKAQPVEQVHPVQELPPVQQIQQVQQAQPVKQNQPVQQAQPVQQVNDLEEKSHQVLNIPSQKRLSVEELKPADHLDAVKLEQDGMINKDYKKEIFIGNHEEIEDENLEVAESKLKDVFKKVDTDGNGKLCVDELQDWIVKKTLEHFNEALQENDHIFNHMDPTGRGYVEWKEYYIHFLLAKGYPLERAKRHVQDYDEIELDYEEREQLIKYKFKWTDADQAPMDNKLTKDEFLAFRHPEQSEQALQNMVKTIMESLDQNGNKVLTEEEFVSLPLGDVDDEEQKRLDKEWQKERGEEFRNHIDIDHNGEVTIGELKRYIDPRNPDNAKSDTKILLEEMDDDNDKCLSWNEVEKHKDMFIQSKIVNVRRILHDEF